MRTARLWVLAMVGMALLQSTGCTLKATFESTTDTTSNFLSSTTPGAWVTEDGLLKAEHKATAFTMVNRENLEQDIARGQGEYLVSLSTLLGVTERTRPAFQAEAQREFQALLSSDASAELERLKALTR